MKNRYWVPFFLGLGFLWFYYVMPPWGWFANSDDAVPYLIATSRWTPQDLYYWGTTRMGMLYEVAFKALHLKSAEVFFLLHTLLVFTSFACWLATFDRWWSRIIFLVFFIPNTFDGLAYYLDPAQPYGVVFALQGIFLWTLIRGKDAAWKPYVLAVLVGSLWIQHELAGFIALAAYGSYYFPRSLRLRDSKNLRFWLTLIPTLMICYFFKKKSSEWVDDAHYSMNTFPEFLHQLWLTVRDGSWWYGIRRGTGHPLTIVMLLYLGEILFSRKKRELFKNYEQIIFLAVLASIFLIHLSGWFIINNRGLRYFTVVLPSLFWVFLLKSEKPDTKLVPKWMFLLACIIPIYTVKDFSFWFNPWSRSHLHASSFPASILFQNPLRSCEDEDVKKSADEGLLNTWLLSVSPTWRTEACFMLIHEKTLERIDAIQHSGCASYLDTYWNSYVLNVVSNGKILTSSDDHIRNPELLKQVLAARPLCFMPREKVDSSTYTANLDCKKTEYGFWVCANASPR